MMINYLKKIFNSNKTDFFIACTLILIFGVYYSIILIGRIPTDLQPHAKMAYDFANGKVNLPPNFLYFLLVALFTGFSKNYSLYYFPVTFLLSIAITAKYFITKFYLSKLCPPHSLKIKYINILGLLMLFVFALPGLNYFISNQYFFGQLVSNVWHNSTVIFLMPFSILLFFKTYDYLFDGEKNNQKDKTQILLLVLVNALIKPSFLFTIIPTVVIFFLTENILYDKIKIGWRKLLPYFFGIVFIAIEYYVIYKLNFVGNISIEKSKSGITISPFEIWKIFSPNCMVAFFTSCFFPLVYILITKGKVLKSKLIQFALINYIIGLLIWILLAEEGFRKTDGNFYWQVVVTSYLFFFTLLIELINSIKAGTIEKNKKWFLGGVFLLHFIWGLFYWIKIIIFKDYN